MSDKFAGCPGAAYWDKEIRKCSECGCIHHDDGHGGNWYCDAPEQVPGYDYVRKTFRPKFCPLPQSLEVRIGG